MIEKQLTIKHFLLILLTFWGCTTTSAWAEKKIFVSPKGNDRAEGTLTHLLRSIQAALEKAEAFENEEVRIILRQGSYEQSKTLEIGSQGKYTSLTICPYQDENVSISGGRVIPLSAMKRISDKKLVEGFPKMYVSGFVKSILSGLIFLLLIYAHPASDAPAVLPGANFLPMIFLSIYRVGPTIQRC